MKYYLPHFERYFEQHAVTLNEENKADKCWHFASIKVDFSKRLDNKLKLSFFFSSLRTEKECIISTTRKLIPQSRDNFLGDENHDPNLIHL